MFRPSFLAALGLVLLMTSSASAQFRGMRFPPSLQNIFMLRGEAVQKELNVTDEQKKTLSELAAQLQAEAMEIISGLQDLSPEEQKEHMPELMKMVGDKGKEIQEKVDKVLDQKQLARMKELSLQSRGAAALEDEEVAAALKISDDQKVKLVAVREEGNKKMEEAMAALRGGGGGGDAGEIRKKMMDMRKELGDKALAVLSSEQREQFEKMKGAKFTFPPQRGPF
jgi:DNA-binding MarR family transcriptional regulator